MKIILAKVLNWSQGGEVGLATKDYVPSLAKITKDD